MKQIIINLNYHATRIDPMRGYDAGLILPVKVLDDEGSILVETTLALHHPITLDVSDEITHAFARLTWPSGRIQTKGINFQNEQVAHVEFDDKSIATNDWSGWAIPRLNPRTQLASSDSELDLDLKKFADVWLRLWRKDYGRWFLRPLKPRQTFKNGAVWQLDLDLDDSAWLLQVGSQDVPWRFVSLPGGGPARVLLTPNDSKDPRGDPIKIIVTSFSVEAESLLEFLARDSMRAANTLAESQNLATEWFSKYRGPIPAVAGAYYLFRRGDWSRIPIDWFEKLSTICWWLPDTALLHCIRILRSSRSSTADGEPLRLLVSSLSRGWPVYVEGLTLLQEAASALRGDLLKFYPNLAETLKELGAAKSWAGASTSFYGLEPESPTSIQWFGEQLHPFTKRTDNRINEAFRRDQEFLIRYQHSIVGQHPYVFFLGDIPRTKTPKPKTPRMRS